MILANETQIARFTGKDSYPNGKMIDPQAAEINARVIAATGGKMPCYVSRIGKRGAAVWVSVGSWCRISKGEAAKMLGRYGAAHLA